MHGADVLPRASAVAAQACIVLAVVVLVGWMLDIGTLKTVVPGLASMRVNTALCFGLSGLSLVLWHRREGGSRWSRLGSSAAVAVAAISLVTIVEYATGLDLGIDQVLVDALSVGAGGRPPLATAIAFAASGLALTLLWRQGPAGDVTTNVIAALGWIPGLIGFVAVIGYSTQVNALTSEESYVNIALHTAAGLSLLGPAIAITQPTAVSVRALAGETPGAALLRWMMPAAILVPLAFGVLHSTLVREDVIGADLGSWIRSAGVMLVLCCVAFRAAQHLNAINEQRLQVVRDYEATNAQLIRANEELEQFASVASHDLLEPLRTITGFSQLLADRYGDELDDGAKRWIEHIVDGGDRMQDLIRGLLDFSRAGHGELTCQETDMAAVVERVRAGLRLIISEADATIDVGPLPVAWGDPRLLEQVFQNLIATAITFGGPRPHVRVRGRSVGAGTRFEVSDDGIGIEPEHVERIFGMFERLNRREDYEGTGIGLAISQRIVERHRGEITVESTPGRGSTFAFTLPGKAS
jgi:signal transduction histidine kinase